MAGHLQRAVFRFVSAIFDAVSHELGGCPPNLFCVPTLISAPVCNRSDDWIAGLDLIEILNAPARSRMRTYINTGMRHAHVRIDIRIMNKLINRDHLQLNHGQLQHGYFSTKLVTLRLQKRS